MSSMSSAGQQGADSPRPRDLGALVTIWTGPPLLRLFYNRQNLPDEPRWTMAEVRRYARGPLGSGSDLASASMVRTVSWFFATAIFLALYIAAAFIRRWTDTWEHPLAVGFMTLTTAVGMFAAGAGMVSGARWSLSWWRMDRLDRELGGRPGGALTGESQTGGDGWEQQVPGHGRRRRSLLLRLSTPSNGDLLFALLWSALLTPALYDSITSAAP
jgi:hypothetical protein